MKKTFFLLLFFFSGIIKPSTSLQDMDMEMYFPVNIRGIGGTEMPCVINEKNEVYLDVKALFDFLEIRNIPSEYYDSISGFFIEKANPYLIDAVKDQITYKEDTIRLNPTDIIKTDINFYLKIDYLQSVFGLKSTFNQQKLTVNIQTEQELPTVKKKKLEEMRENLKNIKGEVTADTTLKRDSRSFGFGMADWSINSLQNLETEEVTNNLSLSLGSLIMGGEGNLSLNYSSEAPFKIEDQSYYWRFVDNDHSFVKQFKLEHLGSSRTIRLETTNTPISYKGASLGTYQISDQTQPGWTVELYVNNRLTDYTTADANGFFNFDVPLAYGKMDIVLRFYSIYGEEDTQTKSLDIPFDFTPSGKIRYTLNNSISKDDFEDFTSVLSFNYGLGFTTSLDGGLNYSSSSTNRLTPSITLSKKIISNFLISTNYVAHSGYTINSNYFKSGFTIATSLQFLETQDKTRNLNISFPLEIKNAKILQRISISESISSSTTNTSLSYVISGSILGVSTNITTSGSISDYDWSNIRQNLTSRISNRFSTFKRINVNLNTSYLHNNNSISSMGLNLDKSLHSGNGSWNVQVQREFSTSDLSYSLGFRYNLPYANTSSSLSGSSTSINSISQFASGGMIFSPELGYVNFNNRTNSGKGGLAFITFFDTNYNGKKDADEEVTNNIKVVITGGRQVYNKEKGIIYILDLQPYTNYFVRLNDEGLESVTYLIDKKTFNIDISPNEIRVIEIPITVSSEAAGMVYMNSNGKQQGKGRVILNFFEKDGTPVKEVISYSDGYFSHLGFKPGDYYVKVNEKQMSNLRFIAKPDSISFTVKPEDEGYLDGLDFVIERKNKRKKPETVENK